MEVEDIFYLDVTRALDSWTLDTDGNITNVVEFG
jgi:hypothetical protein